MGLLLPGYKQSTRRLSNPYLDCFASLPIWCRRQESALESQAEGRLGNWAAFKAYIATCYSWAVPTTRAILEIASRFPKIVEIGAGTGYWSWLLSQTGVDVVAFDIAPSRYYWFPIVVSDETAIQYFPDRALLLCWPPWSSPMAENTLSLYGGNTVIFIGEWMGGCANWKFFEKLAQEFELKCLVELPQWFGRYDNLYIFARKGS